MHIHMNSKIRHIWTENETVIVMIIKKELKKDIAEAMEAAIIYSFGGRKFIGRN